MSNTRAISAAAMRCRTMSDGSLRIEVEVEPADAQAAFAMFGKPGAPMALAALVVGHAQAGRGEAPPTPSPKQAEPVAPKPRAPRDPESRTKHALSELAAKLCRDPRFWAWAELQQTGCVGTSPVESEPQAVTWMRDWCEVESRARFDDDKAAAERFHGRIRVPWELYCRAKGIA